MIIFIILMMTMIMMMIVMIILYCSMLTSHRITLSSLHSLLYLSDH